MRSCRAALLRQVSMTDAVTAALMHGSLQAQTGAPRLRAGWCDDPPALSTLVAFARTESDLRVAVDRYLLDKSAIELRRQSSGRTPPLVG